MTVSASITESVVTPLPVTVITPSRGWTDLRLRELWEYRELLFMLAWRDVKVKYKQAVLGVGWALIQPLLSMIIFTVIFGKLAKLPSDGIPYPVFTFAALLPWQLFSTALAHSGNSLVANSNLLTKVYFPRLIIPLAAVLSGVIDFAISSVFFLGLLVWYGITPSWAILTLPLFILFALVTALAVGLWLSALNVEYRDVQYTIPFILQLWLYASPVAYSADLIPQGAWRMLYGLNPMAGVIQGFRWALCGGKPPDELLLGSVVAVIFLLITGLWNFKRMERTFADVV
jgi:lipopolysaccharide transport system permease protein